ncbi:MAG: nucleotide exchange factor GrpE [Phaeodactylibacter sp.]|nr:nucleotide exchange factor GrpE [Phaeodactylibacter sp.]MCB9275755.1 nucleotide exchange factor GrpE [Lewinellaceae bacterium]
MQAEGEATTAQNAEEREDSGSEYQKLRADYSELKDKYLRLFAEFDNFKKRTIREKMDMMKTAAQDTMSALLPVLDDFDRARKVAADNDKGQLFEEGIGLVYQKLYGILKQRGLEPMETDGEPFDPELHEAFTEIPAPTEALKGRIVDTIEKGYKLNDKIIRHAKVVVGK